MFAFILIPFILECSGFCYLFYKYLEMSKDIEILYNNYSKEIEKITRENVIKRRTVLK